MPVGTLQVLPQVVNALLPSVLSTPAVLPSVVAENKAAEEAKDDPSKSVVGIIYPPPEVRNIVDKTASFVARNGPEFEARIRQNEINNSKFNFLTSNDPYHAYYRHKVNEFREGKAQEPSAAVPKVMQQQLVQKFQTQVVQDAVVPKEPPPDWEFMADPPSIAAFDLDVVKLTAQFVARNGRSFLSQLMAKEQRNFVFDFLRPQHSLFHYFTKLVEQYTKIFIPPKGLMQKLRKEAENPKEIMDLVRYRVEWLKFQERERKKEEEEREKERVAFAQIDWHDFVVVETVDFQPHEQGHFPPPTTPDELGARILAQERYEKFGESEEVEMEVESEDEMEEEEDGDGENDEGSDKEKTKEPVGKKDGPTPAARPAQPPTDQDNQIQDMDEGSDEEEEEVAAVSRNDSLPAPLPPTPDQVVIRKDYDPKASRPVVPAPPVDKFFVSPITGERIPAGKIQEHMRIGLLDPHWIQERERSLREKQNEEEVFAQGRDIESSLKQLAERRTDIFGVEETAIGKKIGEEEIEKPEDKVTWDGHTGSMARTQQAAQASISLQEQIEAIHKAKGLVGDEEGKDKIGPSKPSTTLPSISMPLINKPSLSILSSLPSPMPPSMARSMQVTLPVSRPPMMQNIPLLPRPSMPPVIRLAPGPIIATPLPPPMLSTPSRISVMPMPPPGMSVRPPPMVFVSGQPGPGMPTIPGTRPPLPSEDEPAAKKLKSEDNLIPEEEFLRQAKGPVTFKVQVPTMQDKSEWKLGGQTLTFTLPLTDQVSVIKAKIHETTGMPAGKQKLQYEGIFIKDSNSLAFYNMNQGSVVHLALKERGGRKK
uniref:splicing factor 3A subunit 1-like n=1 Tax=Myxine glutinosa TaxID=7769 RepID=UPI00358F1148